MAQRKTAKKLMIALAVATLAAVTVWSAKTMAALSHGTLTGTCRTPPCS